MPDLPLLRVPGWETIEGLRHGFFGRHGGVSVGPYASLNLSARLDDDAAAVSENRRRVETVLGGSRLVWMRQVHGNRVARVQAASADIGPADGMVTSQPGTTLAVLTADCVPILLVARRRRVAAAVHAGWRGTIAGVVREAITVLHDAFGVEPGEIEAALGPAIGGCCYEVERDIGEQFMRRWGELPDGAWCVRGRKGMLDLREANRYLMRAAGLPAHQLLCVGPCTRCAAREYFSHRASGGTTGRQLSCIGWTI
jgi:purine-nucleoside/S-methyl-5'-thioadenosine phosphorylase / adenosine deaminase